MKQKNLLESLTYFETLPDSAHVRLKTVCHLYAISPATVWRNVKIGNIPKPHKLTARTTVWNVGELRISLSIKGDRNDH